MNSHDDIIKTLTGKPSVKTREACRDAVKLNDPSFCQFLEKIDLDRLYSKNWETTSAVINALGSLHCDGAAEVLERLAFRLIPEFDYVTNRAALAWVRIMRTGISDAGPVIAILERGTLSAVHGALDALGYNRMMPDEGICDKIIEMAWDYGKIRPRGLGDPRYGLAAACAGWNCSKRTAFLEHCLECQDVPLVYVAKHSLKGKYVKLR